MGEYYKVVNVDKNEYIHPHGLGDGLKASEQLYNVEPGGTLSAMYVLMICPEPRGGGDLEAAEGVMGRWHGDRVIIIGDYAEQDDIQGLNAEEISDAILTKKTILNGRISAQR